MKGCSACIGSDNKWLMPIAILLAFLTLITYWPVKDWDFIILDDPGYVSKNTSLRGDWSQAELSWAWTSTQMANWHPVTWMSLMVDRRLFGLNPKGYHWTNLILHLSAGILLFLSLARMTGAAIQSGTVAALFLIHPLHVESVAWISERKDVLSALFWMIGLWTYARYVERPKWARYVLVLITFILGLLAKPMAVTFPFVLLLLDWWPLSRMSGRRGEAWSLIKEKLPLVALSAASAIVTFWVQHRGGAVLGLEVLPLTDRLSNAAVSYVKYLVKTLWPADLAIFYPYDFSEIRVLWPLYLTLLILLTLLVLSQFRNRPYLAVGWLWFMGCLVPVIGIVQVGVQAMADRYTYLPSIGLYLMMTWGVTEVIVKKPSFHYPVITLLVLLLATLVMVSRHQVGYWKDSESIFTQATQNTTKNAQAHSSLGIAFSQKGDIEAAIGHYKQALSIQKRHEKANNNLGHIYMLQGKFNDAERHFRLALAAKPEYSPAIKNLGDLKMRQGKTNEAIQYYQQAFKTDREDPELRNNYGVALFQIGQTDLAVKYIMEALQLKPDYVEARQNLAKILNNTDTRN